MSCRACSSETSEFAEDSWGTYTHVSVKTHVQLCGGSKDMVEVQGDSGFKSYHVYSEANQSSAMLFC